MRFILAMAISVSGCFELPSSSTGSAKLGGEVSTKIIEAEVADDGSITAEVDTSKSSDTQVLKVSSKSSSLSGMQLSMPPGSLKSSTSIKVQESASLANTLAISGMGTGTVKEVSVAVMVIPTKKVDPVKPLTMSLPISSNSFALEGAAEHLAVAFKHIKYAAGETIELGIIPFEELIVTDGSITFQTPFFGSFQVIKTQKKIEEVVTVKSTQPILTKVEEIKKIEEEKASAAVDKTPPVAATALVFRVPGGAVIPGTQVPAVTLAWVPAQDAETPTITESIEFYASSACTGTPSVLIPTTVGAHDISLPSEGVYSYLLRSKNNVGEVTSSCSSAFYFDTTSPSAPTGLVTSPVVIAPFDSRHDGDGSITFVWAASIDTESPIVAYNVSVHDNSMCSGTAVFTQLVGNTTQYTFTGNNLSFYTFKVSAINSAGGTTQSSCSAEIYVDTAAPSGPTNLVASSPYYTNPSIVLSWNLGNHSSGTHSLFLKRYTNSNCSGTVDDLVTLSVGDAAYTYVVSAETFYSFKVEQRFNNGIIRHSACSPGIAYDVTGPSAPSNLRFADSLQTGPSITLDDDMDVMFVWDASTDTTSGVANYRVDIYGDPTCSSSMVNYPGITNAYGSFNLGTSVVRYFRVMAYDQAGNASAASSCSSSIVVADTVPTMNIGYGANMSTDIRIYSLIYGAFPGISGFQIHRSTTPGTGFTLIGQSNVGDPEYQDTTASPLTTYYYKIRPYRGTDVGHFNTELSITTLAPPPAPPTNIKAVPGTSGGVDLTWSPSAGATGYKIFYSTDPAETLWTNESDVGSVESRNFFPTSPSVTYYFRVAAYSASGTGDKSTPVVSAQATAYATGGKLSSNNGEKRIFSDPVNANAGVPRLWAFACSDTSGAQLATRYSNDNGSTWMPGATVDITGLDSCHFSVDAKVVGGAFVVALVYAQAGSIKVRTASTPSGSSLLTWSMESIITSSSMGVTYSQPQAVISDPSHFLYVTATKSRTTAPSGHWTVFTESMTAVTGLSTYSAPAPVGEFGQTTQERILRRVPGGDHAVLVINHGGALMPYRFDGTTWSSIAPPDASISLSDKAWVTRASPRGFTKAPEILKQHRGDVFAAGNFHDAGGHGANDYLARWDGQWVPVGSGVNAPVTALYSGTDGLYVGGYFEKAGGAQARRIARFDGGSWHSLGGGLFLTSSNDAFVSAITEVGDEIFVAGDFDVGQNKDGTTVPNLDHFARYNRKTGVWAAIGLPLSAGEKVRALATIGNGSGTRILVGGDWSADLGGISGTARLAAFNPSNNTWESRGAQSNAVHHLIPTSNGADSFYVGSDASPFLRYHDGSTLTTIPAVTSAVSSFSSDFAHLYGSSSTAAWRCDIYGCGNWIELNSSSLPMSRVVKSILRTSMPDATLVSTEKSGMNEHRVYKYNASFWEPLADDRGFTGLNAIEEDPSTQELVFATSQSPLTTMTVGGGTLNRLMNVEASFLQTIGAFINTGIATLFKRKVSSTNRLHIGGTFGMLYNGAAYWDGSGFVGADTSIAPASNVSVFSAHKLFLSDDVLLAGSFPGTQFDISGSSGDHLIRIDSAGVASALDAGPQTSVGKITGNQTDNFFVVTLPGSPHLATFDNTSWSSLNTVSFVNGTQEVRALYLNGSTLFAGGNFSTVNASPTNAYFIRVDHVGSTNALTGIGSNLAQRPLTLPTGIAKILPYGANSLAVYGNFWKFDAGPEQNVQNIALYNHASSTWQRLHEGVPPASEYDMADLKMINNSLTASSPLGTIRQFKAALASGVSRFSVEVTPTGDLHIAYESYDGSLYHRSTSLSTVAWSSPNLVYTPGPNGAFALSVANSTELGLIVQRGEELRVVSLDRSRAPVEVGPMLPLAYSLNLSCTIADAKIRCLAGTLFSGTPNVIYLESTASGI